MLMGLTNELMVIYMGLTNELMGIIWDLMGLTNELMGFIWDLLVLTNGTSWDLIGFTGIWMR